MERRSAAHEIGHVLAVLVWGRPSTFDHVTIKWDGFDTEGRTIGLAGWALDPKAVVTGGYVAGVLLGANEGQRNARIYLAGWAGEDVDLGAERSVKAINARLDGDSSTGSDAERAIYWHGLTPHAGDRAHLLSLYTDARDLLLRHRVLFKVLTNVLLARKILTYDQVRGIVGSDLDALKEAA